MSNDTIRVGVVGAGANTTTHHIPKLQAIDGVEVISVCNRSRESSERVAQQFGIPTTYENWQELVAASDTNAIVIGTWPYMHCRLTLAALAANKHVMCEARMAMNAQEAHAMRNASRENTHLSAQIVPSPFSLRVDNTIKRLIGDGYIGDVLAVEVRAGGTFLDPDAPMHWRDDFNLSGFNIMSMGIWYEALLRWVGEATEVVAMGKPMSGCAKMQMVSCALFGYHSISTSWGTWRVARSCTYRFPLSPVWSMGLKRSSLAAQAPYGLPITISMVDSRATTHLPKSLSLLKRKVVGEWRRNLSVRFVGMRSSPIRTLKMV